MNDRLSLLPLRTVLFPGMRLPLHVVEDRYRHLIRDCLETGDEFGVVLLSGGENGQPCKSVYCVGTSAQIEEATIWRDGDANLLVRGHRRFSIVETDGSAGVLKARVLWLEDADIDETAVRVQANRLRQLFQRYVWTLFANLCTPGDPVISLPANDEELSYFIPPLLRVSNRQKQELLAAASTFDRISLTIRFIEDWLDHWRVPTPARLDIRRTDERAVEGFVTQYLSPN